MRNSRTDAQIIDATMPASQLRSFAASTALARTHSTSHPRRGAHLAKRVCPLAASSIGTLRASRTRVLRGHGVDRYNTL